MNPNLPIYKVVANSDDTEMIANSIVEIPAHLKRAFVFSSNERKKFVFADQKRGIIMGVAIAADELIYRNDNGEEYYVYFDADSVWAIREKLMRNGMANNMNLNHSNKTIPALLLDSYIIDDVRGFPVPTPFADQHLKNGSWIVSYKVDDKEVLRKVESGELGGFSIEAYLDLSPLKFSKIDPLKKLFSKKN